MRSQAKKSAPPADEKTESKLITLKIEPHLLDQLDACAKSLGLSRAGALRLSVVRFLAAEEKAKQ